MMDSLEISRKLPNPHNEKGKIRTVGVEFEFTGIGLEVVAKGLIESYGGYAESQSTFVQKILNSSFGDFTVEIDSGVLKDKKYQSALEGLGFGTLAKSETFEHWLLDTFATVVPYELVTPPIPVDQISVFDEIREALRKKGALGTKASILYGFGFHINIETPSLSPAVIQRYMQAFLLLYPWIVEQIHVDFTRGVLPYISPFPKEYADLILSTEYGTSGGTFIEDYLEYNPTRNRPLDLLPLLAFIDKDLVGRHLPDGHYGSARPTFHFRMPNCLIDDPNWTVQKEWQVWLAVEELADNPMKLRKMIVADSLNKHSLLEAIEEAIPDLPGMDPEIA